MGQYEDVIENHYWSRRYVIEDIDGVPFAIDTLNTTQTPEYTKSKEQCKE
jgi:hypothetical protein